MEWLSSWAASSPHVFFTVHLISLCNPLRVEPGDYSSLYKRSSKTNIVIKHVMSQVKHAILWFQIASRQNGQKDK